MLSRCSPLYDWAESRWLLARGALPLPCQFIFRYFILFIFLKRRFLELYAIFFEIILLFGSMTGLAADLFSRIFQKFVYNVLHRKLRKTLTTNKKPL